jgi:hypothetical protein
MTRNTENDVLLRAERKAINARYKIRNSREPKKTEAELRAFIFGTPEISIVEGK